MKENTSALHVQLPVDVATYLLNEKRGEVYDIEVRQRINIVLIPNIHIETPNYTITRIRHDDIKSNETISSYKLVEKNTEENSQVSLEQKNKPVRLQAAVQGIKLAQPAPIREDNSSRDTSLLDKFLVGLSLPIRKKPNPILKKNRLTLIKLKHRKTADVHEVAADAIEMNALKIFLQIKLDKAIQVT